MIVIRLFCAGGCSSDVLAKRVVEAAKGRNLDADISAHSCYYMEKLFDKEKVDVALIAPQIAYDIANIKKICDAKRVPYALMPGIDYGRCNGDHILDLALQIVSNHKGI